MKAEFTEEIITAGMAAQRILNHRNKKTALWLCFQEERGWTCTANSFVGRQLWRTFEIKYTR